MSQTAPVLLRGNPLADRILAEVRAQLAEWRRMLPLAPGFGVVLAGGDELAVRHLERKRRACAELGLVAFCQPLPTGATTTAVRTELTALGENDSVDGVLLQYPLPAQIDARAAYDAIPPGKDIDVTTSANLAQLPHDQAPVWPAVVQAAEMVAREYSAPLAGRSALVIGDGELATGPLALWLRRQGARVTQATPHAADLRDQVAAAEVVATSIGRPEFIKTAWLQPGAVVIDTRLSAGASGPVGDVESTAAQRAAYLTPAPGGLGKLTLALLLQRTVRAAGRRAGLLASLPAGHEGPESGA